MSDGHARWLRRQHPLAALRGDLRRWRRLRHVRYRSKAGSSNNAATKAKAIGPFALFRTANTTPAAAKPIPTAANIDGANNITAANPANTQANVNSNAP